MRSSFRMGVERYWTISLVVGLLTAGHARGDIVDGIRALGDSIAVWQTAPPAWDVTPLDDDWDGVVRDTLDARGDSVLIRYPALYENRFISSYLEIQKAGEKGYSVLSEWQDSVWVVSGQAVGTADEGWSDSNLQDYFRARLLQLRLLLHANLEKVNVPLFGDTVSVELTLVGRDIQRFTMSHDAALGIVRHISGGALSHAFFLDWKGDAGQKVVQWGVFIRSAGATTQHVLMVEDRIGSTSGRLDVEGTKMRLLPGILTDNVVDVMAKDMSEDATKRQRWTVEIRGEP